MVRIKNLNTNNVREVKTVDIKHSNDLKKQRDQYKTERDKLEVENEKLKQEIKKLKGEY